MHLAPTTKVLELLEEHPYLKDFLKQYAEPFRKLDNPLVRHTFGRFATFQMAASMGGLPLAKLLEDVAAEIRRHTGQEVTVEAVAPPSGEDAARKDFLKGVLHALHAGEDLEALRARFAERFHDVSPVEIARLENEIIAEGVPADEVRRLCDVHVAVFRPALEGQPAIDVPPGHPVHSFRAENAALGHLADEILALLARGSAQEAQRAGVATMVARLADVEKHYLRKEHQLFPVLERLGIVGPPQVMWAVHDETRKVLAQAQATLKTGAPDGDVVRQAAVAVQSMIEKEERILFPMCLELLDAADWAAVRQGEEELGYALISPPPPWPSGEVAASATPATHTPARLPLDTGLLSLEQVNLLLNHLPVEVSFVDEHDEVRFYSGGEQRLFPRSPGVIGRKVQNCHPPASVHIVQRILDEFRAGTKDVAEFWIDFRGRFVHIRYFAMRSPRGEYRGTLEVTQDVTGIRQLEGQRRLLDW